MGKYCRNCGNKLEESYKACPNCGTFVDSIKKEKTNNTSSNSQSNYFAIIGFALSIVSNVLCCGVFNIVSLGLSIAGLVLSKTYSDGKGFAIAGIIISCLPLLYIILYIIIDVVGGGIHIPFNGYHI